MTDFDDLNDEQDVQDEPTGTQDSGFRKRLEREAQRAKEAAAEALAEANAAKREAAFLKAGVNPDSPLGKMFTKSYDGDLSVDAIKTAASEVGLIATSESPAVKESMTAAEQVASASQGASTSATPDPLTEFSKLREPGNWNKDAVVELARSLGSNISYDDDYKWMEPENKYTR